MFTYHQHGQLVAERNKALNRLVLMTSVCAYIYIYIHREYSHSM